MKYGAAALLVVASACCAPRPAIPWNLAPVAEAERVWRVVCSDGTFGTGFPIRCVARSDGTFLVDLLTARHVARDGQGNPYPSYRALRSGGPEMTFQSLREHETWDASIVSFSSPEWVLPHELDRRPLRVGTRVWHSGYQLGHFTITDGYVTAWNRVTSPTAPGGSGGPVLDRHGRVVGVVVRMRYSTQLGAAVLHLVQVVPIMAIADWL